jgi:hypothetical protein
MRAISAPIASAGSTQSTPPASMAARTMPSYFAPPGSWAKEKPPDALMACRPMAPSLPVPDKTTPMAPSAATSASELKNRLTEGLGTVSLGGSSRRRLPSGCSTTLLFGGVT